VQPQLGAPLTARVVSVFGSRCAIELPDGTRAEAVRRGRRTEIAVGDRVSVSSEMGQMIIDSVAPRSSLLFRSDAQRTKVLAANVAQVAVVFAPQPRFRLHFLWRTLIAAAAARIEAVAVLNKTDLDCEAADRVLGGLRALGARCLRISARRDPQSAARALEREFRGRETLLVGQSGMGKSTILNLLVGATAPTQAISGRIQAGRHTTSASHWHALESGGAVIDTPGFHEFGLSHIPEVQLPSLMADLAPHATACRFGNCRHLHEPGCGVRAALAEGNIDADRYAFYESLCSAVVE